MLDRLELALHPNARAKLVQQRREVNAVRREANECWLWVERGGKRIVPPESRLPVLPLTLRLATLTLPHALGTISARVWLDQGRVASIEWSREVATLDLEPDAEVQCRVELPNLRVGSVIESPVRAEMLPDWLRELADGLPVHARRAAGLGLPERRNADGVEHLGFWLGVGPLRLWLGAEVPVVEADGRELRLRAHGRQSAIAQAKDEALFWIDLGTGGCRPALDPLRPLLAKLLESERRTRL
ncbi:MAG: hypothetical protein JST54_03780 [Deltaproteobacteria bacterium]|nr:hypothetical protein [Deltaproteobacteria bacterium]